MIELTAAEPTPGRSFAHADHGRRDLAIMNRMLDRLRLHIDRVVDHSPILELEKALIDDMPANPGLVAYYNVHWPDTGWGNLVLFVDDEAKDGWGHDQRHFEAIDRSPPSLPLHPPPQRGGGQRSSRA